MLQLTMQRSESFDSEAIGDVELVFEELARSGFNLGELEQRGRRQDVLNVITIYGYCTYEMAENEVRASKECVTQTIVQNGLKITK